MEKVALELLLPPLFRFCFVFQNYWQKKKKKKEKDCDISSETVFLKVLRAE